jgi:polyisoprenyl-teichoic acid--peptidoglycan teichoic acid transferase
MMQPDTTPSKRGNYSNLKLERADNWLTWFWLKHDRLSRFNRLGLWVLLITFTTIASTISGAILTLIPSVDRTIISLLESSSIVEKDRFNSTLQIVYPPLTSSVNLLFIEIEPTLWGKNAAHTAFAGHSRRIWLWQFKPQQTSVKVIDIPRDSKVKIPGVGWGTIDDANLYGGTALVSQMVSQSLGIPIDRYLRVTPNVMHKLTNAILDKPNSCTKDNPKNCNEELSPQQIRELAVYKFDRPKKLAQFTKIATQLQPQIDTNLSPIEMMSLTGFMGQIPDDRFQLNLFPGYTPLTKVANNSTPVFLSPNRSHHNNLTKVSHKNESFLAREDFSIQQEYNPFRNKKIVIQNTTDNPELTLKVFNHLARYNFQNVSVANHLPLKLGQTKLVTHNDVQAANYLQAIFGMGKLELAANNLQGELTIRIGDDMESLTLENTFVR